MKQIIFIRKYRTNCDGDGCPRMALYLLEDAKGRGLTKLCERCLERLTQSEQEGAKFIWEVEVPMFT